MSRKGTLSRRVLFPMQLGMHLRELCRVPFGLAISCMVALFVALTITYEIDVLPPGLEPRTHEMATASAHVLVDTPKSTVLDLRQGTLEFEGMTNRAVLLGNVMASVPVREYIARRAGVPADRIRATTPTTPEYPRAIADPENRRRTSDILRSTDEYRLKISANPTVPVLDVYSQAPTADASKQLANAAVDGLRDYLATIARTQGIPESRQVRLEQLGRARGGVINGGVNLTVAALSFLFVFALSCAAVLFLSRVRRGWRISNQTESLERARAEAGDARDRLPDLSEALRTARPPAA
jgi:hypothetical protein